MTELDFEQLAESIIDMAQIDEWPAFSQGAQRTTAVNAIVSQLRQVWNARGAADVFKVNASMLTGNVVKVVDAIKALDR